MDSEPEPSSNDSPERPASPVPLDLAAVAGIALFGALAFTIGWIGVRALGPDPGIRPSRPDQATIVEVIDGDTVEIEVGGRRERVRLLGVDAPESVHPSVPEQCFGREASAGLAELLAPGSVIRLERDVEARDRYQRLLLYLYRAEDDLFVNRWLLDQGLADTSFYEPNTARSGELTAARAAAKAERIGLWAHCDGPDQPLE